MAASRRRASHAVAEATRLASRALARGSRWFDKLSGKLQPRAALNGCPTKLHFGCGYDKRPGYLNVDIDPDCSPDLLIVNGDYSAIPRRYFTEVLAKDVVEHIPRARTLELLLDCADYLVNNGKLVIQTTSVLHIAARLKASKDYGYQCGLIICLFGNQQHPGDFHFTGFTETTLQTNLIAAGFTIEKFELREGWMFYVEASKTSDWTCALDRKGLTDREFVLEAHQAALCRGAEEAEILNCERSLCEGATRKHLLKQLFSRPERVLQTAEHHECRLHTYAVNYDACTHNHARIEKLVDSAPSPSLRVQTDDAMYSYAVSFALDPLSLDSACEMCVVVDLEVEAGVIGVACTTLDWSVFADREVFVAAGARRKVDVPSGAPHAAHHLMVRNVNPDGRSVASIRGIEIRRAT